MKNHINFKKIVFPCIVFVLLVGIVFGGLQLMESTVFNNTEAVENSESESSKTVEKENTKYFPRQDITTFLVMGIDEAGEVEDSGLFVNEGFADAVAVIVFDETAKEISIIAFNRDSMVEMPILGFGGKEAGTTYAQLAKAHSYGSGLEDSCENVVKTVSGLLGGFEIDYYISVNMGAVPIVNDAVGGVTVNVTDDFSAVDPEITKGEYTLFGDKALTFVRARKNVESQLNISRMERQKEYVGGFIEAFNKKSDADEFFAVKLYEKIHDYMVTNCSSETLAVLAERYDDYEIKEIVTPKGENVLGEEFYEFYIDEEDLERIVLEKLYTPK